MAGNKTQDGFKISKIVSALEQLLQINIRKGKNHPYVARFGEQIQPSPIARSTNVERMLVPQIVRNCGIPKQYVEYALRNGKWDKEGWNYVLNANKMYKQGLYAA